MATTQYATLANTKTWLGITTTAEDTRLGFVLPAISRAIDSYCRRRFFLDDAVSTREFTPEFPDLILCGDISTTTGLIVKTDTTDDGMFDQTWTENNRTTWGYRLEPVNALSPDETIEDSPYTRIVALAGEFPLVHYSVQVTAKWGWPAVPSAIEQATYLWASRIWKRKDAVLGVSGGPELGFVELARRMDPDIKALLDPYRVLDIGGI